MFKHIQVTLSILLIKKPPNVQTPRTYNTRLGTRISIKLCK